MFNCTGENGRIHHPGTLKRKSPISQNTGVKESQIEANVHNDGS